MQPSKYMSGVFLILMCRLSLSLVHFLLVAHTQVAKTHKSGSLPVSHN